GGAQAHLDPLVGGVEEGDVRERLDVEVRVELPVEHVQDVAVERRGDALGVVVGTLQAIDVLHEIGAEQEAVAGSHGRGQVGEELLALRGREVADGAAEEGDHPAPAAGQRVEVVLEVPDHRVHAHTGVGGRQLGGRGSNGRL